MVRSPATGDAGGGVVVIPGTTSTSTVVGFAEPTRCVRKLAPGEVKRVPARGGLVGFYVCCPSCAFANMVLHEEREGAPRFDEAEPSGGTPPIRSTLSLRDETRCFRCHRTIRIRAGTITAE